MITIENLGFSYGAVPVLNNISFQLEDGRIFGLLGENGAGKTTLLTLLAGLKKPLSGKIEIDGQAPYDRLPSTLSEIYYLPDEVLPLNERPTSFARHSGTLWSGFDQSLFEELAGILEVNLTQKMNKMSSGQLKKTYIAFALATRARYLFLDEPTNGLDIPSKASFRKALARCSREDGSVIISTHQVKDLENMIDPIIILDKQDVILNASIEEITSKLYFDYGNTLLPNALYSEMVPGGFIQVVDNVDAAESKVNLEALFNAAYKNKEYIKHLFEK